MASRLPWMAVLQEQKSMNHLFEAEQISLNSLNSLTDKLIN